MRFDQSDVDLILKLHFSATGLHSIRSAGA